MKTAFSKLKSYLFDKKQNKIVYRFVTEQEKVALENNDISKLGGLWHNLKAGNTHRYKKGVKYMHFFDKKEDAITIYREFGKAKQYFCTYSIPNKILRKYVGKGFYIPIGYDDYTTIKEYAIPSAEFDTSWIVSINPTNEFLKEASSIKI